MSKNLDNPGIEPWTVRMQSRRATTAPHAHPMVVQSRVKDELRSAL